jgi:hypothetical protein
MQVWIVAAYRSERATFLFLSKISAYLHSIKAQPEDTAADLVEGNAPMHCFAALDASISKGECGKLRLDIFLIKNIFDP